MVFPHRAAVVDSARSVKSCRKGSNPTVEEVVTGLVSLGPESGPGLAWTIFKMEVFRTISAVPSQLDSGVRAASNSNEDRLGDWRLTRRGTTHSWDLSGRGTTRAEAAQGTPTQSHVSPSVQRIRREILTSPFRAQRTLSNVATLDCIGGS